MASDKGARGEVLDERLAEARDHALLEGEKVISQETGDQGQAIVLTDSRVLLLKAGIAATGSLNGRKVSAYPPESITTVNVRKGPMGAVIQVCTQENSQTPQAGPPENIIVFSGPQRVRKCEAIAERMREVLRVPVETIEPTQVELESLRSQAAASEQEAPPAAEPVRESACEVEEEQHEERVELRPNPRLPKPIRRKRGPSTVLILFGILVALLLVGVAVTTPLKQTANTRLPEIDVADLTRTPDSVRRQRETVEAYRVKVKAVLHTTERTIAMFDSAIRSGNRQAIVSTAKRDEIDAAWRELDSLAAPPGLATSKADLTSGLFACKTAIADASSSAQSSGTIDTGAALRKIAEARTQIRKGMESIDRMRNNLTKQLASLQNIHKGSNVSRDLSSGK